MPNMSYCRFENTYQDLQDCYNELHEDNDPDELSESESDYRDALIELCTKIANEFEK